MTILTIELENYLLSLAESFRNDGGVTNNCESVFKHHGIVMSAWKELLIKSYRLATTPLRKLVLARQVRTGQVPVHVLFYHRVADEVENSWTMNCQDFEQQINWLQENFDLISLSEAQRRIRTGNDRPAVSITFDDGYSDNSAFALPLMIERKIPVTYFVTTHHTTHGKPFPHDEKRNEPLPANSIESLRALANAGVEIGGHTRMHCDLGSGLTDERIYDEVIAATRELETMVGVSIQYFAFPFGQKENLDPRVFRLLQDNGFAGVCSAYGGLNEIDGDAFHLQRIHGDPNFERMKNWLTGDPRLGRVVRYQWQQQKEILPSQATTEPDNELVKTL